MSVLESTDIMHPAIEALFTIDEETGMTGAIGLQAGYLDGEILLNLDTEDDDEIGVGCAGGIDITAFKTCELIAAPGNVKAFKITVTGLRGHGNRLARRAQRNGHTPGLRQCKQIDESHFVCPE
jgi:dipeptidase D